MNVSAISILEQTQENAIEAGKKELMTFFGCKETELRFMTQYLPGKIVKVMAYKVNDPNEEVYCTAIAHR